jgi:uncharacterized membrane protein YesL
VSRADRRALPPAPTLGGAVRAAASDFYYNSVRLIPANLLWGAGFLAVLFVYVYFDVLALLPALVLIPLTAGLMAMATVLVREKRLFFSDFVEGIRRDFWRNLGLGALQLAALVVLGADLLIGLQIPNLVGIFLAVSAGYALIIFWAYVLVAWPLLLDPVRRGEPATRQLRLGALLLLAHPFRVGAMALVILVFLAVATITVAGVAMFALALTLLVAAHYVLPAADRIEGRETLELDE